MWYSRGSINWCFKIINVCHCEMNNGNMSKHTSINITTGQNGYQKALTCGMIMPLHGCTLIILKAICSIII